MFRITAFRPSLTIVAVSLILGLLFARVMQSSAPVTLGDFRAAYCESRAAARGVDPYAARNVAACESAAAHVAVSDDVADGATVPGTVVEPLAPFTFALIAPFALLDYDVAASAYLALALLLVSLAVYALRRLTRLPVIALACTFALGAGVATFAHGTLVPIALASICVAAALLRRGEDGWAGLVAAGTLIDPLIGIAVCSSLAIWRPRTRVPIFSAAAVVIVLSAAALGPSGSAEFYFDVLPATLFAQNINGSEYGIGYFLHAAGFSVDASMVGALVWDSIVVVSAIPLARRYARVFRSAAAYATVPAALVLVGGTGLDLSHVALALLACCMALVALPTERVRALAALVLLATPWPNVADALSRLPLGTLLPPLDRAGSELALKSPTWFGLLLLCYVVTRSGAVPVPIRVRPPAGER
jgi:hypothetical protein